MFDKKKFKKLLYCFYEAGYNTVHHDGIEHAGYLAFLAILSLFPFLVFFFALVGFLGQTEAGIHFIAIILDNDVLPSRVIDALSPRIAEIISGPPQGLLTVAIIGAIWTASSTVEGLRTVLNRAYRVHTPPAYILRRLVSIGQFIVLTSVITITTLLLIIIPQIWENIRMSFSIKEFDFYDSFGPMVIDYIRYSATALVLFIFVVVSYHTLPNIKQKWISVIPGAIVVLILWFIAGSMFTDYLRNFDQVNIIYGSLGGFIAALLFFYISATIFIYGAELNFLVEKTLGHKIEPKEKS